ncbi:MAG: hypothetical protein U0Z17_09370 [Bacteroidales bacterium]
MPHQVLAEHGAVSEQTVLHMASEHAGNLQPIMPLLLPE